MNFSLCIVICFTLITLQQNVFIGKDISNHLISMQFYPYSLGTDASFSASQIEGKFDNINCD